MLRNHAGSVFQQLHQKKTNLLREKGASSAGVKGARRKQLFALTRMTLTRNASTKTEAQPSFGSTLRSKSKLFVCAV